MEDEDLAVIFGEKELVGSQYEVSNDV